MKNILTLNAISEKAAEALGENYTLSDKAENPVRNMLKKAWWCSTPPARTQTR